MASLNFPPEQIGGQKPADGTIYTSSIDGKQWQCFYEPDSPTPMWRGLANPGPGIVYRGGIDLTKGPSAQDSNGTYVNIKSGNTFAVVVGNTSVDGSLYPGLDGYDIEFGTEIIYDGVEWQVLDIQTPMATEKIAGKIQIATKQEVLNGTGRSKAVVPEYLKEALDLKQDDLIPDGVNGYWLTYDDAAVWRQLPSSSTTKKGITRYATLQETNEARVYNAAVTPASIADYKKAIENISDIIKDSAALEFQGKINVTTDDPPANPKVGHFYANTGVGTVKSSWGTNIVGVIVEGGEMVAYGTTGWYFIGRVGTAGTVEEVIATKGKGCEIDGTKVKPDVQIDREVVDDWYAPANHVGSRGGAHGEADTNTAGFMTPAQVQFIADLEILFDQWEGHIGSRNTTDVEQHLTAGTLPDEDGFMAWSDKVKLDQLTSAGLIYQGEIDMTIQGPPDPTLSTPGWMYVNSGVGTSLSSWGQYAGDLELKGREIVALGPNNWAIIGRIVNAGVANITAGEGIDLGGSVTQPEISVDDTWFNERYVLKDTHVGQGGTDEHPLATTLEAGFMGAADRTFLNELPLKFAPISHVGTGGNEHPIATTTEAGFMSSDDKIKLNNIGSTGVTPVGTVIWSARQTAPSGYLIANGDVVPEGVATIQGVTFDFSELFQALGTSYGVAGQLPDLRGEFIRGADLGRGVDFNRTVGSFQADEFRSHNHTHVRTSSDNQEAAAGKGAPCNAGSFSSNTGTRGGNETRPRNIALLPCIKF